ncbi:hypothetical protein [Kocuria marina]|uniref:hypothetical protein n=1 Tax=Kocuria marina TaxID=223184 RepID=UPI003460A85E
MMNQTNYATRYRIKATGQVWDAVRISGLKNSGGYTIFTEFLGQLNVRAVPLVDPETCEIRVFLHEGLEPIDGDR